jgi:hypothetical protein
MNDSTNDPTNGSGDDTTRAIPPTQEIAQATQRIPEGPAPEGEVHPAYGAAAARVQAEAEATAVHDAPVHAPGQGTLPQPAPVGAAAGAQAGAASAAGPAEPGQPARRGPRVGTAVWGLIVIAIGLGILAVSAGVVFDLGAALIVLLGAAGVILVVGSVVSSLRRR